MVYFDATENFSSASGSVGCRHYGNAKGGTGGVGGREEWGWELCLFTQEIRKSIRQVTKL